MVGLWFLWSLCTFELQLNCVDSHWLSVNLLVGLPCPKHQICLKKWWKINLLSLDSFEVPLYTEPQNTLKPVHTRSLSCWHVFVFMDSGFSRAIGHLGKVGRAHDSPDLFLQVRRRDTSMWCSFSWVGICCRSGICQNKILGGVKCRQIIRTGYEQEQAIVWLLLAFVSLTFCRQCEIVRVIRFIGVASTIDNFRVWISKWPLCRHSHFLVQLWMVC